MKRERYVIPIGTKVQIRNLEKAGDKNRTHVTRKELRFDDRSGTGYDGAIFYFEYETWEIAVHSDVFD